jgi:hypothetical protein
MPDRATLVTLLRESARTFTDSFRDLPPDRLHFRPALGRWSVAETAEHVILAEVGSGKLMRGRMVREAPPPDLLAATADGDERIERRLARRDRQFPAPDFVLPTGRWATAAEMIPVFDESRFATIDFLEKTELDLGRYAAPHPALGPLTGLQWAYFLVRHCLRHVEQIEETKSARRP